MFNDVSDSVSNSNSNSNSNFDKEIVDIGQNNLTAWVHPWWQQERDWRPDPTHKLTNSIW